MTTETFAIFIGAEVLICSAIAIFVFIAGIAPRTYAKMSGERGYARHKARESLLFSISEPAIRLVAAWVRWIPMDEQRIELNKTIRESGEFLGLDADELIALSIVSGVTAGLMCFWMMPKLVIAGTLGGLCLLAPVGAMQSRRDDRALQISRELPRAIDILALCVSAGMDFPGSIRELIGEDPTKDGPLSAEFRRMLRDLGLGHSRKQALLAFQDRAHGEGIKEFVAAIIQSEEKGNPLGEVLMAQATMLRMRRSFRAEVMASKAGVKMVIPMAMLMFGMLILIIAPLMLRMREFGL